MSVYIEILPKILFKYTLAENYYSYQLALYNQAQGIL